MGNLIKNNLKKVVSLFIIITSMAMLCSNAHAAYLLMRYNANGGTIADNPYYYSSGLTSYATVGASSSTTYYYLKSTGGNVTGSATSGGTYGTYGQRFSFTAVSDVKDLVNVGTFKITRTGYHPISGREWRANSATGTEVGQSGTSDASAYRATITRLGQTTVANATKSVYVNWEANTYTVHYDANGGSGTMADQTHTYGSSQALTGNTFTRPGYTFNGWSTEPNGTRTEAIGYDTYSSNSPQTYTIQNKPPNGTQAYILSGNVTKTYFTVGTPATELDCRTTKCDYDGDRTLTFYRTASGSTYINSVTFESGEYSNGESVSNLTDTNNGTVTLYAQWAPIQSTVSLNPNGGTYNSSTGITQKTMTYDSADNSSIGVPTRNGYDFLGWYDSTSGGNQGWDATGNYVTGTYWGTSSSCSHSNYATVNLYYCIGEDVFDCDNDCEEEQTFRICRDCGMVYVYAPSGATSSMSCGMCDSTSDWDNYINKWLPASTFNGLTSRSEYTSLNVGSSIGWKYYQSTGTGWSTLVRYRDEYPYAGMSYIGTDGTYLYLVNSKTATSTTAYRWNGSGWDTINSFNASSLTYKTSYAGMNPLPTSTLEDVTTYVNLNGHTYAWETYTSGSGEHDIGALLEWGSNLTFYARWAEHTANLNIQWDPVGQASSSLATNTMSYTQAMSLPDGSNANQYVGYYAPPTGVTLRGFATTAAKAKAGTVDYQLGATIKAANVDPTDTTLYAVWGGTLTYNANGHGTAPSSQQMYYTPSVTAGTMSASGWTFLGWNTSSTATTASIAPNGTVKSANAYLGDTVLYGVWKRATFTVTFNDNGGSGGPGTQTKSAGTNLTLSSVQPTRTNHTFAGWSTTQDAVNAGTANYQAGGTYSTDADITLYALWRTNYTVVYNKNAPSGVNASDVKGTVSNQSFTYGTSQALRSVHYTTKQYRFLGWSTNSSATTATYRPGQSVSNLTSTAGGTFNLYAIWEPAVSVGLGTGESKNSNKQFTIVNPTTPQTNISLLKYKKVGSTRTVLSNVKFRLNGTANNGTKYTDWEATTTSSGIATWSGIYDGTYDITEISVPNGVVPSTQTWQAVVTRSGNTYSCVFKVKGGSNLPTTTVSGTSYYYIDNEGEPTNNFTFHKYGSSTSESLSGIGFSLTGTSDYNTTVSKTATSASTGLVTFSDVPYGTYKLTETSNPSGRSKNEKGWTVEVGSTVVITDKRTNAESPKVSGVYAFYNPTDNIPITFTKKGDDGSKLSGIKFTLTGSTESGTNVSQEATSNTNGVVTFSNIQAGMYHIEETSVFGCYKSVIKNEDGWNVRVTKDPNTYILSYEITDIEGNPVSNNTLINTLEPKGPVVFVKKDTSNEYVQGAMFELTGTSDNGTYVDRYVPSSDEGVVSFSDIYYGTYTMTEMYAPSKYKKLEEVWTVKVDETGFKITKANGQEELKQSNDYVIIDPLYTADVKLKKVNKEDHTYVVDGATYELSGTADNGSSVRRTATSEEGILLFKDIPVGTYNIIETEAPDGYVVDENIYEAIVTSSGVKVIKAPNIIAVTDVYNSSSGNLSFTPILTFYMNGVPMSNATVSWGNFTQTLNADGQMLNGTYVMNFRNSDSYTITYNGATYEREQTPISEHNVSVKNPSAESLSGKTITIDGSDYLLEPNESEELYVIKDFYNGEADADTSVWYLVPYIYNADYVKYAILNWQAYSEFEPLNMTNAEIDAYILENSPCGTIKDGSSVYAEAGFSSVQTNNLAMSGDAYLVEETPIPQPKGKFTIRKVDGDDNPLEGATFMLDGFSDNNEKIKVSKTTPSTGLLTFENVPKGSYTLTETVYPEDYIPLVASYDVNVDELGTVRIYNGEELKHTATITDDLVFDIVNKKPTEGFATFKVVKLDKKTHKAMGDVFFELEGTATQGGIVITWPGKTQSDGSILYETIPSGTYTLTETTPNNYYQSTPITVMVNGEDVTFIQNEAQIQPKSTTPILTYEIENEPYQSFKVHKVNENKQNLEDATFTLLGTNYELSLYDVNYNGSQFNIYRAGTTTKVTDNVRIAIDEKGSAETTNGTISVSAFEETPATGDSYTITIGEDSYDLTLANGTTTIKERNSDAYSQSVISGFNGIAEFTNIPEGNYVMIEESAPEGYLDNATIYNVSVTRSGVSINGTPVTDEGYEVINTQPTVNLNIKKVNSANTALSNASFTFEGLSDTNESISKSGTTDSSGIFSMTNVPLGSYELTETEAPSGGYKLLQEVIYVNVYSTALGVQVSAEGANGTEYDVTTVSGIPTITVKNYQYPPLKVKKVDGNGMPLTGAQFTAYNGTTEIKSAWVDDNGIVTFEGLTDYSSFTIKETIVPEGYLSNGATYYVSVNTSNTSNPYTVRLNSSSGTVQTLSDLDDGKVFTVTNTKPTYPFTIKKTDASSGAALQGAKFTLTKVSETGDAISEPLEGTTASNGMATWTDLTIGNYVLEEIETPTNYIKQRRVYSVEVAQPADTNTAPARVYLDGAEVTTTKSGSDFYTTITNSRGYSIDIRKFKTGTTTYIEDATLSLYDNTTEEFIDSWETESSNHTVILPSGTYKIVEDEAPYGYMKSTNIIFTISASGTVSSTTSGAVSGTTVTVYDSPYKGTLTLNKTDGTNPLGGATFNIVGTSKANTSVNRNATSTSGGIVSFTDLELGNYTLTETAAPSASYEKDTNTYEAVVYEEEGVVRSVVTNEQGEEVTEIVNPINQTYSDINLSKNVTGSLGDLTKNFAFTLNMTNGEANKSYTVLKNGSTAGTITTNASGAVSYQFTMKDGETLVFKNMPDNANFTITEAANNHIASYVTNTSTSGSNSVNNRALTTSSLTVGTHTRVDFTNNREIIINTGTRENSMNIPLMMLILLIQVVAFFELKEKSGLRFTKKK